MSLTRRIGTIFLLLLLPASVLGEAEVIDRIAAIVNEEIILLSEVDERIFLMAAQGQIDAKDTSKVGEIRQQILNSLVEEKLVVQRAASQGITVSSTEILEQVDKAVDQVRSNFPTEAQFQKALESEGITLTMLRERYENDIRQERLASMIVGREVRGQINITTEDVQRYFHEHKEDLPVKPAEVRLAHLVVEPKNSDNEDVSRNKAGAVLTDLRSGGDFDKAVDDNPGSLGASTRFCQGDLDPAVEEAVTGLEIDAFSEPYRGVSGWHVFQVTQRESDCFELRYVLFSVQVEEGSVDEAKAQAEEARQLILDGSQFGEIVKEFSDDTDTRDNNGDLGWTPLEALLPEVAEVIDEMGLGSISQVVRSERGFHVFRLVERREGGAYTFDEIREQLRQYLEQQELQEAYQDWLTAIRDSAYVEVKVWSR